MKQFIMGLACVISMSNAFAFDLDFDLDLDELTADLKEVTSTVSDVAQEMDFVPDEIKSALSSSDNVLTDYTREQEVQIGQQMAGRILGAAPLVDDKKLQQYVNKVGSWVANHSERADLSWHFGVIESDSINAFAAPGGYVLITKGLYKTLNNEAELAGVLAHEISHVIRRHHLAILKKSSWIQLGKLAADFKLGGQNDTIDSLMGNGAEMMARGLDKDAELESDRMAIVLMARSGYDAYAFPAVLQQIGHASERDGKDVELLFTTHPHPNERLDGLATSMAGFTDKGMLHAKRFYRI
jgi:predicted Zn-dependent protease